MLRFLVLILITISCSSQERTKYQAYVKSKGGGYKDKSIAKNLKVVTFNGNSYTKKKLATKFGKFRALEICTQENYKLAYVLGLFDRTQTKIITRTSSSGYPSYYYGMSPFYNRYSGVGYGFAYTSVNSNTWDESIQYPYIEVLFNCLNEAYAPLIELREIPAEDMKHLVKDLRGGLQVEKVLEASPNMKKLKTGDVILRANGERVQEVFQLLALFNKNKSHDLEVDLLRDGVLVTGLILKGANITDDVIKDQQDLVKSVCRKKELKKHPLCK
jgi:hypothetical protein